VGIPEVGQSGSLEDDVELAVQETLDGLSPKDLKDRDVLAEKISQGVRRYIKTFLDKKPIVICHVIR
jgi:mRNA degradation ribonuclease J1/J2